MTSRITSYPTKDYWIETTSSTNIINHHAYNTAGCLTNLNGTALEWDERYRLLSVDDASSFVQYTYDVLNRRVSRIEGSTTNYFVYNGNQVVADLDGNGDLLRTYIWGTGIDNLLSFTDHTTSNTYYAIKDHQNTVIALTDSTGTIVESYEYDAYGRILDVKDTSGNSIANQQSAIGNRYAFQGREIDWTTGLIYFRARWYNPETGRWLSKDPIGISGGLNLYVFCGNNPVNFIDPMGLDAPGSYNPNGGGWGLGDNQGITTTLISESEHRNRNQNNQIPRNPPTVGSDGVYRDSRGNAWVNDDLTPYHGRDRGNSVFRGTGSNSGSEAVYLPDGTVIDSGPDMGTYNYSNPRSEHGWRMGS